MVCGGSQKRATINFDLLQFFSNFIEINGEIVCIVQNPLPFSFHKFHFKQAKCSHVIDQRASPGRQDGVQVFPHADVLRDVGAVVT